MHWQACLLAIWLGDVDTDQTTFNPLQPMFLPPATLILLR
uniref:Uncharacterized protein n=1 Tax=Setaria viridis TaxID=4556 RepID=A0A4U6TWE7_SETVI|nr:hypothetical protein SEVIR_7G179850v2 [Setaria viridis]